MFHQCSKEMVNQNVMKKIGLKNKGTTPTDLPLMLFMIEFHTYFNIASMEMEKKSENKFLKWKFSLFHFPIKFLNNSEKEYFRSYNIL